MDGGGPGAFKISVKVHHTTYTHSHLDAAENEQQRIKMISVVVREKQVYFIVPSEKVAADV